MLQTIGEYHLGEFVNKFSHGSLVMQTADTESARIPTVIFGTINGVIGVIASLPSDMFNLLEELQVCNGSKTGGPRAALVMLCRLIWILQLV